MSFKYTVVCDTIAWLGYDFYEDTQEILQAIKDAGYDGADLPGDPTKADPKELRKRTDAVGLKVPEVLGAWAYFHGGEDRDFAGGNPDARKRGVTYAKKTLDYAAELGAQYFEICAPQPPIYEYGFPKLPIETMRKNFIEALRDIHAHAVKCGITILLEPLNCYEAYPQVLTSVHNAIQIIEASGLDSIGIQPDVFHMNVAESSTTDALRAAGKYVKHVHLNETNHYALGTGHADYPAIIRALKDIGFDGYLAIYMPYVSQELFHMSGGYGADSGLYAKITKPDLRPYLEWPINYLKQIETMIDREREIYEKD